MSRNDDLYMETKDTKTEKMTQERTQGRVLSGTVVASKMQDTISVVVDQYVKHPKYKKYVRRSKKYLVHDKGNTATVGEKVSILEVPPISKRKRFELVK